jgi:hypothetical protein
MGVDKALVVTGEPFVELDVDWPLAEFKGEDADWFVCKLQSLVRLMALRLAPKSAHSNSPSSLPLIAGCVGGIGETLSVISTAMTGVDEESITGVISEFELS